MNDAAIGWREHDSAPAWSAAEIGVLLFLAGEVLFFAGLIAAALVLRAGDPAWAAGAAHLKLAPALAGTALLLGGSLLLARGPRGALGLAALAGAGFLALTAWEWRALMAQGLDWRSGTFGSCFFVITGLHALHVLGGVAWTALLAGRPGRSAAAVRLASWYWHLVDGVWIALVLLFYWRGA